MRLTGLILVIFMNTALSAQDEVPTNKHFWYSMKTTASAKDIWSVWIAVDKWKDWDTGLKDATIEGEFVLGAEGTIISLEDRTSKFRVVEYEEGKSYTYKTKLPLGSLYVKRHLKTENDVISFTHEVWFKGLTGGIFAKILGQQFKEMLPNVLLTIKTNVEKGKGD